MDHRAPVGDRKNGPFGPFIEEFRMKAAEFTEIMQAHVLCNQGMANALGINVRRVRAYAADERPIPKVVALAAWALLMKLRVAKVRRLLEV